MTHSSVLVRVNIKFDEKIREIQKFRKDKNLPKFSYNQITKLYNKHNSIDQVYNDIANHPGFDDDE